MKISDLYNKKIAILWFGLEWKSTLNFLLKNKILPWNITILDLNKDIVPPQSINTETGENYLNNISRYDIIFKTAWMPLNEKLIPVKNKITIQMQFFLDNYKGKVIWVTASKWKSTMSSLLYQVIKDAWKNIKLVWNIWTPVLDEIDFQQEYDYVVCEISSYMLEFLDKKNYISILWSIFPEHIDWHNGLQNYVNAKLNILKGSDINVVCQSTIKQYNLQNQYHNIISYGKDWNYSQEKWFFTKNWEKLFSTRNIKLLWQHNKENICAIIAAIDQLWIDLMSVEKTIKNFTWLPHRLEFVGTYHGIDFYDDAISTTPESTIQAIKTLNKKIDTIFLWWVDRWYDFSELAKYIIKSDIKNIVLFSPSWKSIKEALSGEKDINFFETDDMWLAVDFAFKYTQKNKICLLSTAAPSYSIRKNFEEKWDLFKQFVGGY